ncbi:hypothetical protein CN223_26765 [Sinorhizobium meliloti]|uniref:hypothetical protein n=1 Tax=Rhizobium meliloti TaxID=382 RepID=UPI000FD81CE6|nr:hypothetical protein [Sinorhizobium meliloti]RVG73036.1 hypothetical protein CN223_26765 [Sinorhizobium meliloti]
MAGEIRAVFDSVYADGPSTSPNEPDKNRIRSEVGGTIQAEYDKLLSVSTTGASWHDPVRVASGTNVDATTGLENGDILDGVTLATGDRVLLYGQTSASQNGIYVVSASGSASRAGDANSGDELLSLAVYVRAGTANAGKQFICTTPAPITVGATDIEFHEMADQALYNAAIADLETNKASHGDVDDAVVFTSPWLWNEPFTTRADIEDDVIDEADTEGSFLTIVDRFGRYRFVREGDPENAADGRPGESLTDAVDRYLSMFGPNGELVEPGQGFGGVVGKEPDGRPFAIDEFGTKTILSQTPAVGEVAMGGPYLVKVAFAEKGLGLNSVRLFKPTSAGGSIYAGPIIVYNEIDGQSLSAGSGATEAYYQIRHTYKGCAMMIRRVDVSVNDVRGANYQLDTQTPSLTEGNVLALMTLEEKLSPSGYGGQTVCSSFADKMFEHMETDVGRPQMMLFACVGVGGASYAELDPSTVWWTNKLNILRAANRIARANGARLIKPFKKLLHGESDHLRYSPAEQAAHSGYYADILAWQAQDNIDTKAITGQEVDVRFIFLAESQRHVLLEATSAVAMLDAMRDHPDKVVVAGPQYPIHAQGHSQADAVHLKASGEVIAGEYLARAEYELGMKRNAAWRPLYITNVAYDGNVTLTVTVNNPAGTTLVIDTATINAREGMGFNVATDGVETAISNVAVNSPTQITITLAAVPPAGTYRGLYYACKGAATIGEADPLTNTPAGNIRNTRTEQSRIPGVTLHDWLCADYRPF